MASIRGLAQRGWGEDSIYWWGARRRRELRHSFVSLMSDQGMATEESALASIIPDLFVSGV
jgi:hypothetical protein